MVLERVIVIVVLVGQRRLEAGLGLSEQSKQAIAV